MILDKRAPSGLKQPRSDAPKIPEASRGSSRFFAGVPGAGIPGNIDLSRAISGMLGGALRPALRKPFPCTGATF
jgi:hypothetical protein